MNGNSTLTVLETVLPLLLFAFSVWMLVDCMRMPIRNKLLWILLILFTGIIGSLIYCFFERPKYSR